MRPEYSSNWAIDHDAQMFYYAVETNNLSEMHLPFLDLIAGLVMWKENCFYKLRHAGWCAHHNADDGDLRRQ
jgi:alpha-L-fucosidase 2